MTRACTETQHALQDPDLHLKHLKQSPPTHEIIDNCIECGFCESNCPSKDVTLTPRQRITTLREQARLKAMPSLTAGQQARYILTLVPGAGNSHGAGTSCGLAARCFA